MHNFVVWLKVRQKTIRSVGFITTANVVSTVAVVIGSFVQARFISPDELGFVRKYAVVSGYVTILTLGLFIILQRDYPLFIGRSEHDRARQTATIVQSWSLLVASVVGSILLVISIVELFQGQWKEASAWFIQLVMVWSIFYVGYLSSIYSSSHEFERLAKGELISSISSLVIIPLFFIYPFPALVLRSIIGPLVNLAYLHIYRPLRVGWHITWVEFISLVKRGLRFYVSDYVRYILWLTIEITLMYRFAGDVGVGLLVFSKIIIEASSQISVAINQVYLPRLAQYFGETGKLNASVKNITKPTLLNFGLSGLIVVVLWIFIPPIILFVFPKYSDAVPLIRILALQIIFTSLSLPLYMVILTESYHIPIWAVILGLGIFIGISFLLNFLGFNLVSVAWGTIAGQMAFVGICLMWLFTKLRKEAILNS